MSFTPHNCLSTLLFERITSASNNNSIQMPFPRLGSGRNGECGTNGENGRSRDHSSLESRHDIPEGSNLRVRPLISPYHHSAWFHLLSFEMMHSNDVRSGLSLNKHVGTEIRPLFPLPFPLKKDSLNRLMAGRTA